MSGCKCWSGFILRFFWSRFFLYLFSQDWSYLLFCSQCQLPTPDNSFGSVSHVRRLCISLYEKFSFLMFSVSLQLSTSTSKLPFLVFLTAFGVALVEITFFYEERQEFGEADLLQRFNKHESGEVCCFILWVWFWQVLFFYLKTP